MQGRMMLGSGSVAEPEGEDAGGERPTSQGRASRRWSCDECRRSKLKCQPSGDRCFPCARCVRRGLVCEDPQRPAPQGAEDRPTVLRRLFKKRLLAADNTLSHERIEYMFRALVMMFLFRTNHYSPHASSYKNILALARVLGEYLGLDTDQVLRAHPGIHPSKNVVMVGGRLMSFQGGLEEAMHPFLVPLFNDGSSSTIGFVNLRGEPRFYVNAAFESAFFSAELANARVQREHIPPPDILLQVLHPEEHRRFDRAFHSLCFETQANVMESSQIYKVVVSRSGATLTTLMRVRTAFESGGEYMGLAFSFLPLPLRPSHAAGTARTVLGSVEVPCGVNAWDVFSRTVGVQEGEREGPKRLKVDWSSSSAEEESWEPAAKQARVPGLGAYKPTVRQVSGGQGFPGAALGLDMVQGGLLGPEDEGLLLEALTAEGGSLVSESELRALLDDLECVKGGLPWEQDDSSASAVAARAAASSGDSGGGGGVGAGAGGTYTGVSMGTVAMGPGIGLVPLPGQGSLDNAIALPHPIPPSEAMAIPYQQPHPVQPPPARPFGGKALVPMQSAVPLPEGKRLVTRF